MNSKISNHEYTSRKRQQSHLDDEQRFLPHRFFLNTHVYKKRRADNWLGEDGGS